jgi:hypothetical protein
MARDKDEDEEFAPEEERGDVPEGAAVFAEIPPELGVHPLLLAVLHATVFLVGSTNDVVHPGAADEALGFMAAYLQRLEGAQLRQVQEDMACLVAFARQEKWPKPQIQALRSFLSDYGIGTEGEE